jgi:hypothetical protein
MATLLSRVTNVSLDRVITVRNPASARYVRRRRATSSATPFSGRMFDGIPPRSNPPWPASITTVENDAAMLELHVRRHAPMTKANDASLDCSMSRDKIKGPFLARETLDVVCSEAATKGLDEPCGRENDGFAADEHELEISHGTELSKVMSRCDSENFVRAKCRHPLCDCYRFFLACPWRTGLSCQSTPLRVLRHLPPTVCGSPRVRPRRHSSERTRILRNRCNQDPG